MRMTADAPTPFRFEVMPSAEVSPGELERLLALFRASYRAPNDDYLCQSLARLRFLATASAGEELAGFAIGEMRIVDLPRLPRQAVAFAGICCIDRRFRRLGLFGELERKAFAAADVAPRGRVLSCGRVAHPASFRTVAWSPTHVPQRRVPPTAWQREVGAAIARIYGVEEFCEDTFVCVGSGRPMFPVIEIDVRPEEWDVFTPLDRERGDSLLALCWTPVAPPGW